MSHVNVSDGSIMAVDIQRDVNDVTHSVHRRASLQNNG